MFRMRIFWLGCLLFVLGITLTRPASGAVLKTLPGHVPAMVNQLLAIADLPGTNNLRLAIGLPLRDAAGLSNFLADVYNPTSPNFRKFLTPEEFTTRFGPTAQDYATVKNFALANGFRIAAEHGNHMLLDVQARVTDVQRAFHIHLRKYPHPREAREFFAPDSEPTVDASLPVTDVSGLNNYQLPHPKLIKKNALNASGVPKSGSAPGGYYIGDDFRAAYLPGTTLTGAGQQVGLFEFDNDYAADISAYASLAGNGRSRIPVSSVLVNGYDGTPTLAGDGEVSLDIQMAMAMAPGLSKIIVFTGGPNGLQNDILNAMAASNTVKNLSCSWGWGGGPSTTTDAIFQQMAAQGQSFFDASGDSDAFTTGESSVNAADRPSLDNSPASDPYITQVGGTSLTTTGPGGSWESESAWNWGGGEGTSGGISSFYSIPSWQANVNMANNQGSTTKRNIPDVAMTADDVYSYYDNGQKGAVGGTSCAAPLWAGLTALINQQQTGLGKPTVGLINQAVYNIGSGNVYSQCFHDITTGDNTWSKSSSAFFAVSGYDLCTGWGTPAGNELINALVSQGDSFGIASNSDFTASGPAGGPFTPSAPVFTLTNSGANPLVWAVASPPASWFTLSPTNGTIQAGDSADVTLTFNAAAAKLAVGTYTAAIAFTNRTSGTRQSASFQLQILTTLSVAPTNSLVMTGPPGGPFNPASQQFTVVNLGATSTVWKVSVSASWLTASQSTGVVAAASSENFSLNLNANANRLKAGNYKATMTVENQKKKAIRKIPFLLSVGETIVSNGGFETGDFTGWILDAGTTEVVKTKGFAHSGKYGAQLGQASTLGHLSQTVPTVAGETYLISLWFDNPKNNFGATPNEFVVQWEGTTLYDQANIPSGKWTELQFTVNATTSGSLLDIGFSDDPYFLGLDDISVKPIAAAVAPNIRAIIQTPAAFNFTFVTVPGSVYQAQYKTNLAQPDWINLGNPVEASTNTVLFTDPDTSGFPQKFYRLTVVGP